MHLIPVFLDGAPLIDVTALIERVVSLLFANQVLDFVGFVCEGFFNSMGHLERVHDWHVTHLKFISHKV